MSKDASRKTFDEEIDDALARMLEAHAASGCELADSQKWLEALFTHYTARMLSDNERIWVTGAIFIPISYGAFAALAAINCLKLWHIFVLAAPSIGILWAWMVIAGNHRSFQQKSEAWLRGIERAMKLHSPRGNKKADGLLDSLVTRPGAIQRMRWALFLASVVAWSAVLLLVVHNQLPLNCK